MDDLEHLREKFKDKIPELRKQVVVGMSLQSFGFMHKDGKFNIRNGQPCYATVPSAISQGDLFFCDKVIRPDEARMPLEKCREYIHHVLNDSYWSLAFVTKDAEDVFHNGAVLSTAFPAKYVISSACAIRYVYEFRDMIRTWNYLSRYFTNGDVKIALMHYVTSKYGSLISEIGPGGHMMTTDYFSKRMMKAILERDYRWFNKREPMSQCGKYRGLTEDMPGGTDDNLNLMQMTKTNSYIVSTFVNTLGIKDSEKIPVKRDDLEKAWVESVLEAFDLKRKEHVKESCNHQRKRRVSVPVRKQRSGGRRRAA